MSLSRESSCSVNGVFRLVYCTSNGLASFSVSCSVNAPQEPIRPHCATTMHRSPRAPSVLFCTCGPPNEAGWLTKLRVFPKGMKSQRIVRTVVMSCCPSLKGVPRRTYDPVSLISHCLPTNACFIPQAHVINKNHPVKHQNLFSLSQHKQDHPHQQEKGGTHMAKQYSKSKHAPYSLNRD